MDTVVVSHFSKESVTKDMWADVDVFIEGKLGVGMTSHFLEVFLWSGARKGSPLSCLKDGAWSHSPLNGDVIIQGIPGILGKEDLRGFMTPLSFHIGEVLPLILSHVETEELADA